MSGGGSELWALPWASRLPWDEDLKLLVGGSDGRRFWKLPAPQTFLGCGELADDILDRSAI